MIGQVDGAMLLVKRSPETGWANEYDAITGARRIVIGQPETQADVCRNTLVYSILRRKLREGKIHGPIITHRLGFTQTLSR